MPKVDWREIDKAARRLAKEWEKTPAFADELAHVLQQEVHRRNGGMVDSCPISSEVEPTYSRWLACFGLGNAAKAAQLLIEILEVKRLVKTKETILTSGIKPQDASL
jgi:hypothetical protein